MTDHPELDIAVQEYIAARQQATAEWDRLAGDDPKAALAAWLAVEQPAWEKFFDIKVKYWNIDHPDDQYAGS